MNAIKRIIITTFFVIISMQLNAMEDKNNHIEYTWEGSRVRRPYYDQTELSMSQALENMRLKKIEEEKRALERRLLADRKEIKSFKKRAGIATIENLLAQPSDEERINLLTRLPNEVREYLTILINERKTLLDKTNANDLQKENALTDLYNLIESTLPIEKDLAILSESEKEN